MKLCHLASEKDSFDPKMVSQKQSHSFYILLPDSPYIAVA